MDLIKRAVKGKRREESEEGVSSEGKEGRE